MIWFGHTMRDLVLYCPEDEIAFKRDMALYGETYQNAETGERIDPARVSLSPDRTTWTYSADTET